MKAVLLAAGLGTRLRPITDSVPKCLVPIHGKPLMQYWLDVLAPSHINDILVNTHYLPDQVQSFIKLSSRHQSITLVHEDDLLGTGGTVLKNRDWIGNETFLLAHADNLTRFDITAFIAAHDNREPGVEITMMTFDTDTPQSCGIVELDQRNVVIGFHEKSPNPPGRLANGAVYIFEPSVVDFMASLHKSIVDISTEVLPHYLGRIQIFHNDDYHRDIGTVDSLRLAELEFTAEQSN